MAEYNHLYIPNLFTPTADDSYAHQLHRRWSTGEQDYPQASGIRRFHSYGVSHALGAEQEGSSTMEPLSRTTEDNKAPEYKPADCTERSLQWRKEEQSNARELQILIKKWKKLLKLPSRAETLAFALEHIEVVREPVYQGPRLLVVGNRQGRGGRDPKIRKKVRERRAREREAFEQLSRYYSLEDDEDGEYEAVWDRPSLLKEVLEDFEVRYPPKDLSTNSVPSASI